VSLQKQLLALVGVVSGIVWLVRQANPSPANATPVPGTIQVLVDQEVKDSLAPSDLDTFPRSTVALFGETYQGVYLSVVVDQFVTQGAQRIPWSLVRVHSAADKVAEVASADVIDAARGVMLVRDGQTYMLIGDAAGVGSPEAWVRDVSRIEILSSDTDQ
jgi:hypothetical protein